MSFDVCFSSEQVDVVNGDGCDLEIRHGDVVIHDGLMRVAVLWGDVRLAASKHDFVEVNESVNLSRVEHELVDLIRNNNNSGGGGVGSATPTSAASLSFV